MVAAEELFLREAFDHWNRGDLEIERYFDWIDPEVVVDSTLTGSKWHGYEGVRNWLADISRQFETWNLRIDEISESRPGVWLINGTIEARGRRSGADLETPVGWVVRFRDGRTVYWGGFLSPEEAAEAAARPLESLE